MDPRAAPTVSVAILAGGLATRLGGGDKGALVVGGRRILDWQLDAVAPLTDDVCLVDGHDRPADLAATAARVSGRNVLPRRVHDRVPGRGPLGGLDAALAHARHDVVLVLAGDMPCVTTQLLRHLVSVLHEGVDVVVPRTKDGYHPLCAVYTRECRTAVARRLEAGQLALVGLLDELRVQIADTAALEAFGHPDVLLANVNTPEDLRRIETVARPEAPSYPNRP